MVLGLLSRSGVIWCSCLVACLSRLCWPVSNTYHAPDSWHTEHQGLRASPAATCPQGSRCSFLLFPLPPGPAHAHDLAYDSLSCSSPKYKLGCSVVVLLRLPHWCTVTESGLAIYHSLHKGLGHDSVCAAEQAAAATDHRRRLAYGDMHNGLDSTPCRSAQRGSRSVCCRCCFSIGSRDPSHALHFLALLCSACWLCLRSALVSCSLACLLL